jgi:sterol desaturase/sphingolipid hydroxylase (fatty acid hydroxylase superfamily)
MTQLETAEADAPARDDVLLVPARGHWLRPLCAATATPLIVAGCMPAWFALLARLRYPLACSLALQGLIVGLLAGLELVIPHRALARRPAGTLPLIVFYNLAATVTAVALPSFVYVPLAHAAGQALGLAALWPAGGPRWLHVVVVLLIVDFTTYWWHRAEHRPPAGHAWMWRLHSVHHAPTHFDLYMGPQAHPLDIAIFGLVGYAFVALLGAPPLAIEAGAFFASIVGAIHHLRAETRCAWLNRLFPFADHHVVHHSRLPEENGNYGNITTLFDQLFGSYIPPRVDPPPVGAWSLPADYPQTDLAFHLRSPFEGH